MSMHVIYCVLNIVKCRLPKNGNVHMRVSLGLGHRHVDARDHCMMNIETYTVPHNENVHMGMLLGLGHRHVDARDLTLVFPVPHCMWPHSVDVFVAMHVTRQVV